jgi:hypothetical protein
MVCDLCNTTIESEEKRYSADQFREAVHMGLRPPQTGVVGAIDETLKQLGAT